MNSATISINLPTSKTTFEES